MNEVTLVDVLMYEAGKEAAKAENEGLRAALEAVEWVGEVAGPFCPWCQGVPPMPGSRWPGGHAPDCKRQKALGLA